MVKTNATVRSPYIPVASKGAEEVLRYQVELQEVLLERFVKILPNEQWLSRTLAEHLWSNPVLDLSQDVTCSERC